MPHEAQERYSSLVLAKMRSENILKDGIIFNNDYEGDPVAGAVKVPVRDGEVKVGDYDRSAGGDLSESSTEYRSILINREKYVNELIDSYDAASVPDNLVADRLNSAGYSMATTLDRDGASTLISQGTRVNVSAISAATVYSDVVDIRTLMSKAKVPNDGRRYLLVTPDIYAAMLKSPLFVQASALGDEVKQSGALGKMAGFTIYEWSDDTANLAMIAGHPRYATRINAWKVPIAVKDLSDAIRTARLTGISPQKDILKRSDHMPRIRSITTIAELSAGMMAAFNAINEHYYNGELEKPVITFKEGKKKKAYGWIKTR